MVAWVHAYDLVIMRDIKGKVAGMGRKGRFKREEIELILFFLGFGGVGLLG